MVLTLYPKNPAEYYPRVHGWFTSSIRTYYPRAHGYRDGLVIFRAEATDIILGRMQMAKVIFRAEASDKLISTVTLAGWLVQIYEDAQGRQYQVMIPPQPKEEGEDDAN